MHWINEVEMVDSVDDLKSSSSTRGIQMPNFEVLDARIASALNRIIHNSHFKRMISLEEQKAQKQYLFLRGRQIAYLIYEYFQVTGANDSVENYADLFTVGLRNDDIQEFDSKWDGILFSMTKNPTWWHLGRIVQILNRNSRPYWNCLTWRFIRRKLDLMITDWRQWWKEVSSRIYKKRNFGARYGNYERNAVVKNQGTKQCGQRILGDFWQCESNGQCSKGDTCSFRHDINQRAKMTQPNPSPSSFMRQNKRNASRTRSPRGKSPSGRMSRWPCKDYLKGICTNSFCEKWQPPVCLFYKTKSGCRFDEKCSYAHRQVDEQPSKRSQKNDGKNAVIMLKKFDPHDGT